MNDNFTFPSAGQIHELELAMQRAGGWSPALVKQMCVGDVMSQVRNVLTGQAEIKLVEKPVVQLLLEPIGTITVPATTTKFVGKDWFIEGINRDTKVNFRSLSDKFKEWFLNGTGKTEDPITEQTFRYHKLRQSSVDGPIVAELGGEKMSETTLAEIYSFIAKQPNGEEGVLLNNGSANIFYVRDKDGVLRTVFVPWSGSGWHVLARSVESPYSWGAGRQVFSRNSVPES